MIPRSTSVDDVISIVEHLRHEPDGLSLGALAEALERRPYLLEDRRMRTYRAWGFVEVDGQILRLSDFGRQFGDASAGRRTRMLEEVIRANRVYVRSVEWIVEEGRTTVLASEVETYWAAEFPGEIGSDSAKALRNRVITFLELADRAGLGRFALRRATEPSRFEVDPRAAARLLGLEPPPPPEPEEGAPAVRDEGPAAGLRRTAEAATGTLISALERTGRALGRSESGSPRPTSSPGVGEPAVPSSNSHGPPPASRRRPGSGPGARIAPVFVSTGGRVHLLEQIVTLLDLAGLEHEADPGSEGSPLDPEVRSAMRRCGSAILFVGAQDPDGPGADGAAPATLLRVGASLALFGRRVALLHEDRAALPAVLGELPECTVDGEEMSWTAGMALMKAVNDFRTGSGVG